MPMASRLDVRVEVRDCAKLVKVVIEKFDDRNGKTSVEYNKAPEKAYVFTFAELGSFLGFSAHILRRASIYRRSDICLPRAHILHIIVIL